jgi:hypothetical protein
LIHSCAASTLIDEKVGTDAAASDAEAAETAGT